MEKKDPPQRGTGARGRKLLRDTHESKTDPEARLYKKSLTGPIKPNYLGHVVTENKNGLIMESCLTEAGRKAEREAALAMMSAIAPGSKGDHVGGRQKVTRIKHVLRDCGLWAWWPLVAEYTSSKNWLNDKEREHPQFALSQKKRRLIEKVFSWIKMVAGLRKTKLRGRRRVEWVFRLAAAAYNLVRMTKLIPAV